MELQDIRKNILFQLDLDGIINTCSVDKSYRQICSSNEFWLQKFADYNLPLRSTRIRNFSTWILEYRFVTLCVERA